MELRMSERTTMLLSFVYAAGLLALMCWWLAGTWTW